MNFELDWNIISGNSVFEDKKYWMYEWLAQRNFLKTEKKRTIKYWKPIKNRWSILVIWKIFVFIALKDYIHVTFIIFVLFDMMSLSTIMTHCDTYESYIITQEIQTYVLCCVFYA